MNIRIKRSGRLVEAIGPDKNGAAWFVNNLVVDFVLKGDFEIIKEVVAELTEEYNIGYRAGYDAGKSDALFNETPSLTDSIERLKPSRVIFEFNRESEEK